MARIVTTPKGKKMLIDLLQCDESRIVTVEDGETISLGGKTLEFIHMPWVHWPETMVTYLREDRVLFSCDFFGSHLATSGLYVAEDWRVHEAAKRYYSEVMMPFRTFIRKHLQRLEAYPIEMIASSHGPVHYNTQHILDSYRDWASDRLANTVVLIYTSMHGSTRVMADYLTEALAERGIRVDNYNLDVVDIGKLAMSLVDAATLVVGSPTVLAGAHPSVISACFLANALRPKLKYASVFGSYSWGGKVVDQVTATISNLKVEVIEPVMAQGYPKETDFQALDRLANDITARHAELGILEQGVAPGTLVLA